MTDTSHLPPVHFFSEQSRLIQELEHKGADVISLDVGSPDLPPHPRVIDALCQTATQKDVHGYQSHAGTPQLRRAWADTYQREFGVDLDPATEVLPLLGSKEGIFHLMGALISPGDLALVPDPGYVTYTRGVTFAGGDVCSFQLDPSRNYLPDLTQIPADIARKARLIWVNYPNNPTGGTATLSFFQELIEFAREHNLLVCHDGAYTRVTFDGCRAPSILEIRGAKQCAVEFNSLSKSHNMAGWRTGVVVGKAGILNKLLTLKTNADSGQFLPILRAAETALSLPDTWHWERNQAYRERRDMVIDALESEGLSILPPQGGMYVWVPLPPGWDGSTFSKDLLVTEHVSVTPGGVFGAQGADHIRIALTQPLPRLEEALERLCRFWAAHPPKSP